MADEEHGWAAHTHSAAGVGFFAVWHVNTFVSAGAGTTHLLPPRILLCTKRLLRVRPHLCAPLTCCVYLTNVSGQNSGVYYARAGTADLPPLPLFCGRLR